MAKKTVEKVFISESDQYLFAQGTHYDIYKKLGAHVSEENGTIEVEFDEPVRAITRGQALVLYDGKYVAGGGTVE